MNPELWYAADVVLYYEYLDGNQDNYLCWDNVVLVQARNLEEAMIMAAQTGVEDASDAVYDGSTVNGRPVRQNYRGIRGIRVCGDTLEDGLELAKARYLLPSRDEMADLLAGKNAEVVFLDFESD